MLNDAPASEIALDTEDLVSDIIDADKLDETVPEDAAVIQEFDEIQADLEVALKTAPDGVAVEKEVETFVEELDEVADSVELTEEAIEIIEEIDEDFGKVLPPPPAFANEEFDRRFLRRM